MPKIDLEGIQQRLDANQPPLKEPRQQDRPLSAETLPGSHPLWELWKRMGEMYGHTWASQQGDTPNDTWVRGLHDITAGQFGAGLRACLARPDTFPPTLPEFRSMCTGYDPDAWRHRAERAPPDRPAIEDKTKKERDLEIRKAELARLRESVGL